MEELLNEIDELLARFEDFTHGKDGEDITKMRGRIALALRQYNVSGSVLKINMTDYEYSCGDGCCYNYGTVTKVNGIELPCHNQDAGTILGQVLEHLGYKVEIEYGDDVE